MTTPHERIAALISQIRADHPGLTGTQLGTTLLGAAVTQLAADNASLQDAQRVMEMLALQHQAAAEGVTLHPLPESFREGETCYLRGDSEGLVVESVEDLPDGGQRVTTVTKQSRGGLLRNPPMAAIVLCHAPMVGILGNGSKRRDRSGE